MREALVEAHCEKRLPQAAQAEYPREKVPSAQVPLLPVPQVPTEEGAVQIEQLAGTFSLSGLNP